MKTWHADLGCGETPKNPYKRDKLIGIDLADCAFDVELPLDFEKISADIFLNPIPYPDSTFDSVSAFDVLEHVPRYVARADDTPMLPFITLMNEIHRVLKPGGLFIASTPAYPHPKAFQDPTHINIITEQTHTYFTGKNPYGRRYGFVGCFDIKHVAWDAEKNAWNPDQPMFRKKFRNLEHRIFKGGLSHLTWEFVAVKET